MLMFSFYNVCYPTRDVSHVPLIIFNRDKVFGANIDTDLRARRFNDFLLCHSAHDEELIF